MVAEIKNLNSYVKEFGEELHKTHLAYAMDKTLAEQRAKEIIDDIIENGLEQTTVVRFPKLREQNKVSYQQLCEKYTTITLEYVFVLCGGELRWILQ